MTADGDNRAHENPPCLIVVGRIFSRHFQLCCNNQNAARAGLSDISGAAS